MDLTKAGIVVRSQGNNPRLLNPDFLARHGIVRDKWQSANVMVLPPIASVSYENGCEITLETDKVQLVANDPAAFDWAEELPRMAVGFLSALPVVKYESVGLNFTVLERSEKVKDKGEAITRAMVKEGPWLKLETPAKLDEIKLRYEIEDVVLTLTEGVVSELQNKNTVESIQFYANFHKTLTPEDDDARRQYINSLSEKYDILCKLLSSFPVLAQ